LLITNPKIRFIDIVPDTIKIKHTMKPKENTPI